MDRQDLANVAFTAQTAESLLDARATAWLGNPTKGFIASAANTGLPTASMILSWYSADFETYYPGGVVGFLQRYVPHDAATQVCTLAELELKHAAFAASSHRTVMRAPLSQSASVFRPHRARWPRWRPAAPPSNSSITTGN
eukprot:SAG11_NODE_6343_length_1332_cov_1.543390_2_plen_141_part_00